MSVFDPIIPYQAKSFHSQSSDAKSSQLKDQIELNKEFESLVLKSSYQFTEFNGKRFNLGNLNDKLLSPPPQFIQQHKYKDEVINYVLNRAFMELPLKIEHMSSLKQFFGANSQILDPDQIKHRADNREALVTLLSNDYREYGLSYMSPQMIEKRNLKVVLPSKIYDNILCIFQTYLEGVKIDVINPLAMAQSQGRPKILDKQII